MKANGANLKTRDTRAMAGTDKHITTSITIEATPRRGGRTGLAIDGDRHGKARYPCPMVGRLIRLLSMALVLSFALALAACRGLFFWAAETAILTAIIVSATPPPPPRVVFVPEARPGYAWQPGYWTLQDGQWAWVDGSWLPLRDGYTWTPTHWEQVQDGSWQLVPGRWAAAQAPPPPPPPQ
jgi:hypothetical protein